MLLGRVFGFALAAALFCQTAVQAQLVIPEMTLQRHGLTRAWRVQVDLNRAVDRIAFITQYEGALYVQTAHAFIHALDAETGKKIWSAQIGLPSQFGLAPGVNSEHLAVINGSTLHVLERATGRQIFQRVLGGAPGTGPALSNKMVFVCMVNGLIEGYHLDDHRALPWVYRSIGKVLTQPVLSDSNLAWTTDKGYFYVATADPPNVRFRVETHAEISSRPAHWAPYLYACSLSGFLYAVNEVTGEAAWKFPAGASLSKQPAAVNGRVYIVSDRGEMIAIDGHSGDERWTVPGITQFCCVSATHVYAVDEHGKLVTCDLERGTRLSTLPLGDVQIKVLNQQTDRIYLASDTGVIQCLREIAQRTPLVYTPPVLKKTSGEAESTSKGAKAAGAGEEPADAAAGENPAGAMEAEEGDDAAMTDEEKDTEDPFEK